MRKWLRKCWADPVSRGNLISWMVIVVFCTALSVFHVPSRWTPDSWPGWLKFVTGGLLGLPVGWLANGIGREVARFTRDQRAFDEARRDIERLERGER